MTKILIKISIIFSLATLSMNLYCADKKENTDTEDILKEFKETKFLQIDQLNVPGELKKIEEQIKQNALDVIVSTKTHTPVYAQKMDSGYSESYKKFHGLEIQIVPISQVEDYYLLSFFYYNWTSRKFDKKLSRRISKYNVLNEMRFGLYELLLGKKFVDDHKDEIEKQNYERIVAVRENEEQQARNDRKKKKLEKMKQLEVEKKRAEQEAREQNKLSRGEKGVNEKNGKKENKVEDSEGESNQSALDPNGAPDDDKLNNAEPNESGLKLKSNVNSHDGGKKEKAKTILPAKVHPDDESTSDMTSGPKPLDNEVGNNIPVVSSLYVFGSVLEDDLTSVGYLNVDTHLRYMGFGARYIQEQETDKPTGWRFTLKVGLPIKKDIYTFPVYRAFETEIYKKNFFENFRLLSGLDFSPVYFVNLPNPGEGINVFENDIFWFKAGIGYDRFMLGKDFAFRFLYLKSLIVKGNQKKTLGGSSFVIAANYEHTTKHGAEFNYKYTKLVGDLTVTSQSLYLSYIYKFEN